MFDAFATIAFFSLGCILIPSGLFLAATDPDAQTPGNDTWRPRLSSVKPVPVVATVSI